MIDTEVQKPVSLLQQSVQRHTSLVIQVKRCHASLKPCIIVRLHLWGKGSTVDGNRGSTISYWFTFSQFIIISPSNICQRFYFTHIASWCGHVTSLKLYSWKENKFQIHNIAYSHCYQDICRHSVRHGVPRHTDLRNVIKNSTMF